MHFGKSRHLARIKAMALLICVLIKVQRVTYTKLASAFGTDALPGRLFLKENPAAYCRMRDWYRSHCEAHIKTDTCQGTLQPLHEQNQLEVQRHQYPYPRNYLWRDGFSCNIHHDGQDRQLQHSREDWTCEPLHAPWRPELHQSGSSSEANGLTTWTDAAPTITSGYARASMSSGMVTLSTPAGFLLISSMVKASILMISNMLTDSPVICPNQKLRTRKAKRNCKSLFHS